MLFAPTYSHEPPAALIAAACFDARATCTRETVFAPPSALPRMASAGACGPPVAASASTAATPPVCTPLDDDSPSAPTIAASMTIAPSATTVYRCLLALGTDAR